MSNMTSQDQKERKEHLQDNIGIIMKPVNIPAFAAKHPCSHQMTNMTQVAGGPHFSQHQIRNSLKNLLIFLMAW